MRAKEFIIEGHLQKKDFYKKNRLDTLIQKLENKEPFQTNDGEEIIITPTPDELDYLKSISDTEYNDSEEIRKEEIAALLPNKIGGVMISSLFKTDEFGGRSSAESGNLGGAIELLKSLAIYAKLIQRNNSPVMGEDIKNLLQELKKNSELGVWSKTGKTQKYKGSLHREVPDQLGNVNDIITVDIILDKGPFLRAVDLNSEDIPLISTLSGILKYVNTESDLNRYSKLFASNNKRDPVTISLVGGVGNKTDIKTTYIDDEGEERPLRHLSMSLKAASNAQVHQTPGQNVAGIHGLFQVLGFSNSDADRVMKETGYIGKTANIPSTLDEHNNRVKACIEILIRASDMLENKLQGLSDLGEGSFIHTLLGNLTHAMTKDENFLYVNFDAKGTYSKLNPKLIKNLAWYVDLEAKIRKPKDTYYLGIVDKKHNKTLFEIRLMVSKKERIAFFFELRDLLELTKDATAFINKKTLTPPKSTNPVVTKSALKTSQPTVGQEPAETPQDDLAAIKKNAGIPPAQTPTPQSI
jgi:hypothetical protein